MNLTEQEFKINEDVYLIGIGGPWKVKIIQSYKVKDSYGDYFRYIVKYLEKDLENEDVWEKELSHTPDIC